jgi:predicted  nucleic acid-binding Zn-ribbon protein
LKRLETLAKEQTNKLEEKVTELERMNDVFVEREFRMKELRDRVRELEESKEK